MKRKVVAVAAGAATAVAGAGLLVPVVASADADGGSSAAGPSASSSPGTAPTDRDQRRSERDAELAKLLAEELGVDEAKVAAALEAVRTQLQEERRADRLASLRERLDAAVAAERLTRAQADAILAAAEAGVLPGRGSGGGRGPGFGPEGPHGSHGPDGPDGPDGDSTAPTSPSAPPNA